MPLLLHVGCGPLSKVHTTKTFNRPEWTEIRLDIDPAVEPDIIGTMTDMSGVPDASIDGLYSSHNIEHLYPHEVPVALAEFLRVLRPDGYAVIACPDLKSVAQHIVDGKLTEAIYQSPEGPIAPLDILYGHGDALAKGNLYMAHRTGFTLQSMAATLRAAGFGGLFGMRRPMLYDLWFIAAKAPRSDDELKALADGHFPPVNGRPAPPEG